MKGFEKAVELPWPPTATYLEGMDDPLPHHLREFLQVTVTGSSDSASISERVERLVSSIGQDICRAAANGKWKLPKHILYQGPCVICSGVLSLTH